MEELSEDGATSTKFEENPLGQASGNFQGGIRRVCTIPHPRPAICVCIFSLKHTVEGKAGTKRTHFC